MLLENVYMTFSIGTDLQVIDAVCINAPHTVTDAGLWTCF